MKKITIVALIALMLGLSAFSMAQGRNFMDYFWSDRSAVGDVSVEEADMSDSAINEEPQRGTRMDERQGTGSLPDEAFFEMFLVHVIALERAASKADAEGRSGQLWRRSLSRRGFSDDEVTVINRVAKEFAAEILPLHRKALAEIKEVRATMARRGFQPPPSRLLDLQQERNKLASRYADRLRRQLSPASVEKAGNLMREMSSDRLSQSADQLTSEERKDLREQRRRFLNQKEVDRQ